MDLQRGFRVGVLPALLWVAVSCGESSHSKQSPTKRGVDASAHDDASAHRDAASRDAAATATRDAGDAAARTDAAAHADAAATDAGASPADAAPHDAGRAKPGTCTPPAAIDAPWEKLSETGCMDAADPTKLAGKVLPYEVNSPLWSDAADKSRGMVLPDGAKIHVKDCASEPSACTQGVADDGKWVFPVGTVFVKSFGFDGKLVETRLFVHFDDKNWVGYSYQWNEAQTEATIVPDERRKLTFNTGTRSVEWNYPSRIDCMKCHNPAGGSTLGPETAQMNRMLGGQNQIDKLDAAGLFDVPVKKPYTPALVIPYAGQLGSPPSGATSEQKARSYLHANCAFCHRPDGDFPNLDLRMGVALKDMQICSVVPAKGDQGVPTATNLTPGMPMQSIMWLRMNALPGEGRMPQIATYRVDADGVKVVGDWITSITACP